MKSSINLIIKELDETLHQLDERQFLTLVQEMLSARRIIVVGVGRVMISFKAWVKRLSHLGLDINYLGSESEKKVESYDLVIIGSSSGETLIPKQMSRKAKSVGAKVFYLGCNPESSVGKVSDFHLKLVGKSQFKSENEYPSLQPMSTLFEQQLYLLGDILTMYIMNAKHLSEDDVKDNHANLE